MLPRKRQRPNPAASSSSSLSVRAPGRESSTSLPTSASSLTVAEGQMVASQPNSDTASSSPNTGAQQQVPKPPSLYGSWPRTPKATASTSIAKENASGGTVRLSKTHDLGKFDHKRSGDALSIRSVAGVSSDSGKTNEGQADMAPRDEDAAAGTGKSNKDAPNAPLEEGNIPSTTNNPEQATNTPDKSAQSNNASQAGHGGWMGWWSKVPSTETLTTAPALQAGAQENGDSQQPKTPTAPKVDEPLSANTTGGARPQSSSWIPFWNTNTQTPQAVDTSKPNLEDAKTETKEPKEGDQTKQVGTATPLDQQPKTPKAGSTWAFWSTESSKSKSANSKSKEGSGEIAVIGEDSEAHPTSMTERVVQGTPSKDETKAKDIPQQSKSTWRRSKRGRPTSMDMEPSSSASGASTPPAVDHPPVQDTESKVPPKESQKKSTAQGESASKLSPNLLLPSFTSTYQMKENPSILKQVAQFLLRTSQPPANHVFRIKDPPKVKKAIAIGVHGLFPAAYLRPMIGQPTGTSLRFASLCADAIRKWTDAHGYPDCEIEKVALEGEGKIAERVENLWRLMLNWIDHIRSADLIILASHSQGVPVSIMLLEKLIDLGIITNAKIGVCAMAGVGMGPFPEYKSSILMGSAAELWEFGDPESANSKRFEGALRKVLEYGARITFIGSIDDQLVPMESAVYSPANHPYIYRAVFIDGRIHAPDFIAHLVGFALKLRNLGVSDHGLIRELSIPLAGSLYSGEGHSRLYYDSAVYDLAIANALETSNASHTASTSVSSASASVISGSGGAKKGVELVMGKRESTVVSGGTTANPYLLPWIMRGLLEEDFVKTELSAETEELLKRFDDWKPVNKALKDVKYRLEAVRSRL